MTDRDVGTMVREVVDLLDPGHLKAVATCDFRLVLGAHLEYAERVAQAAISAGVFAPSEATAYFTAALKYALEPRDVPARVAVNPSRGLH